MVSVFDAVVDKFKQDRFWILQLQMDCLDLVWRRSLSQVFCQIWVSLQIPSLCVLGVMELEELLLEIMALWTKTKLHSFYRSYSKWWMPLLFMMIQHNLLIFSPLIIFVCSPTYNISIIGVRVGRSLIDAPFHAIFDSGTSFTYLTDPIYTTVSESVSIENICIYGNENSVH